MNWKLCEPIMIIVDGKIIDTRFDKTEAMLKVAEAKRKYGAENVTILKGWKNYTFSDRAKKKWKGTGGDNCGH